MFSAKVNGKSMYCEEDSPKDGLSDISEVELVVVVSFWPQWNVASQDQMEVPLAAVSVVDNGWVLRSCVEAGYTDTFAPVSIK